MQLLDDERMEEIQAMNAHRLAQADQESMFIVFELNKATGRLSMISAPHPEIPRVSARVVVPIKFEDLADEVAAGPLTKDREPILVDYRNGLSNHSVWVESPIPQIPEGADPERVGYPEGRYRQVDVATTWEEAQHAENRGFSLYRGKVIPPSEDGGTPTKVFKAWDDVAAREVHFVVFTVREAAEDWIERYGRRGFAYQIFEAAGDTVQGTEPNIEEYL